MRKSRLLPAVVVGFVALSASGLAAASSVQASPSVTRPHASAAARSPVAGRHLVIEISGLAKGHKGDVVVTGPKGYRHTVTRSATLTKLRTGTYRVSVRSATAPHGARIYPTTRRRTAHVSASKGARLTIAYTTTVPKTTKAVAGRSITKIKKLAGTKRQLRFDKKTTLKKGDIIASGVSATTPNGLLDKVVSVSRNGMTVVTEPATLLEAVPTGELSTTGTLTAGDESPQARRAGLVPDAGGDGPVKKDVDEPLAECDGSASAEADAELSIAPAFELKASWNWLHGLTRASLTASITEQADLAATLSAEGSCKGHLDLFKKPLTFATFVVWVGPVPIVLQPQLQITFAGEVKADASITTSATQSLSISSGLVWTKQGVTPTFDVTNKHSYKAPTLSASGSAEVSVNPELDLLIDGVGGPEIGLTGGLELSADTNADPWWKLEGSLQGNIGITIPDLDIDKRANLPKKTWDIAHASGSFGGDDNPAIVVTPDDPAPWGAVSNCDDGDSVFEVDGSGFAPDSTVDLSSDWADYGSVQTDSSGSFDVDEQVGELADADFDDYSFYADGTGGESAVADMTLDGDACLDPSDANGEVTATWGVNGLSADSDVSLLIDGDDVDDVSTDDGGSAGDSVTFDCPDDGTYTWDFEGTDNGHDEDLQDGPIEETCSPGDATPHVATTRPVEARAAARS